MLQTGEQYLRKTANKYTYTVNMFNNIVKECPSREGHVVVGS